MLQNNYEEYIRQSVRAAYTLRSVYELQAPDQVSESSIVIWYKVSPTDETKGDNYEFRVIAGKLGEAASTPPFIAALR